MCRTDRGSVVTQAMEEVAGPLRASGPPSLVHAEFQGFIESRHPKASAEGTCTGQLGALPKNAGLDPQPLQNLWGQALGICILTTPSSYPYASSSLRTTGLGGRDKCKPFMAPSGLTAPPEKVLR